MCRVGKAHGCHRRRKRAVSDASLLRIMRIMTIATVSHYLHLSDCLIADIGVHSAVRTTLTKFARSFPYFAARAIPQDPSACRPQRLMSLPSCDGASSRASGILPAAEQSLRRRGAPRGGPGGMRKSRLWAEAVAANAVAMPSALLPPRGPSGETANNFQGVTLDKPPPARMVDPPAKATGDD